MAHTRTHDLLVQADHDGELGAAEAASLAAHAETCEQCQALYAELEALGRQIRAESVIDAPALRSPAPALRSPAPAVRPAAVPGRGWFPSWSTAIGAFGGLMLGLAVALVVPGRQVPVGDPDLDLVTAHVRALLPGHLIDVTSDSHHVVRPWFAGRVDFAPPVKELAAEGFALSGARVDYLGSRIVAVLVYRAGPHLIELYLAHEGGADRGLRLTTRSGFHIADWREGGLDHRAITDAGADELSAFFRAWRAPSDP